MVQCDSIVFDKKKVEKIAALGALEATELLVAQEQNSIPKWTNSADKKKGNNSQPEYSTGKLSMCPPSLHGGNAMAAMILEGLSDYLKKHWIHEEMKPVFDLVKANAPKITGIRRISGNRYELFVQVEDCLPTAFKTLLKYSERMRRKEPQLMLNDDELGQLIGMIVGFAKERASSMVEDGYVFQNFAYIVSRGAVTAQDVHIDLDDTDQYQFGMLCSPKGELTSEYQCGDTDNVIVKGVTLSEIWNDLPPVLKEKLDKIEEIQTLIDGYGPLLSTSIQKVNTRTMVTFGAMLRLRGRVMHCGPAVTKKKWLEQSWFSRQHWGKQEHKHMIQIHSTAEVLLFTIFSYTHGQN